MSTSSNGQDSSSEKRDRGILTNADREYLHGEKEDITDQAKRDTRYRIRKRMENGLVDLGILAEHLKDKDRERVFETIEEDYGPHVIDGIFALPVRGIIDIEDSIDEGVDEVEEILERVITGILYRIDDEYMIDVDVDVDANREKPNVEELREKFRHEEETSREFQYLARMGEIEWNLDNMIRSFRHARSEGYLDEFLNSSDEIQVQPKEGDPISIEHGGEFERLIEELRNAWPDEQQENESE